MYADYINLPMKEKPFDVRYSINIIGLNPSKYILCKQGTLFGVFNQQTSMIERIELTTQEQAKADVIRLNKKAGL